MLCTLCTFFGQNESASMSQMVPRAQGGWICISLSCISLKRYPGMPSICLDGLMPVHSPCAIRTNQIKSYSLQLKPTQNGEERTRTASHSFSAKSLIAQSAEEGKNNLCSLLSLTRLYLKSQTQPDLDLSHSVQRKFRQSEDVEPHLVGRAVAVELGLPSSFERRNF